MKAKELIERLKEHPESDIVVLAEDGWVSSTVHDTIHSSFENKYYLNIDINSDLKESIRTATKRIKGPY